MHQIDTTSNQCHNGVMNTTWKSVVGFEGRYEVSDAGQVRSFHARRPKDDGILKQFVQKTGYHHVTISPHGKKRSLAVHRLVLQAFVGPCPDGHLAAHWDGDPSNNHVSNLRWATPQENMDDRTRHGRTQRGENVPTAKLNRYSVKTIKRMQKFGFSAYEVARLAGMHASTIQRIYDGLAWASVSATSVRPTLLRRQPEFFEEANL